MWTSVLTSAAAAEQSLYLQNSFVKLTIGWRASGRQLWSLSPLSVAPNERADVCPHPVVWVCQSRTRP